MAAERSSAEVLDTIQQRGVLIVGVKADYRPFGFRSSNGEIIGIEPDLAADLAKRLGLKVELVPVIGANRIEFLNKGKVDILIATVSDTPERRKIVQAIDPPYYSDPANVLLAKTTQIKSWEELNGKPLCATSGSWYNKEISRKYGADIIAFDGSAKPLLALKQGNCVGYLFDQTFLAGQLLDYEMQSEYALPLKGIMDTPWIICIAQGNPKLQEATEKIEKAWFTEGTIVTLQKKWAIEPTEASLSMHAKYKDAATGR